MIISCENGDYKVIHGEDHWFESNKEIHVLTPGTDVISVLLFRTRS